MSAWLIIDKIAEIELATSIDALIPVLKDVLQDAYVVNSKKHRIVSPIFNGMSEFATAIISLLQDALKQDSFCSHPNGESIAYIPSLYLHPIGTFEKTWNPCIEDRVIVSLSEKIPYALKKGLRNPRAWHREMELHEAHALSFEYGEYDESTESYKSCTFSSIEDMSAFKKRFYDRYDELQDITHPDSYYADMYTTRATGWRNFGSAKGILKNMQHITHGDERLAELFYLYFNSLQKDFVEHIDIYHTRSYTGLKIHLQGSKEYKMRKGRSTGHIQHFNVSLRATELDTLLCDKRQGVFKLRNKDGVLGAVNRKSLWIIFDNKRKMTDFRLEAVLGEFIDAFSRASDARRRAV